MDPLTCLYSIMLSLTIRLLNKKEYYPKKTERMLSIWGVRSVCSLEVESDSSVDLSACQVIGYCILGVGDVGNPIVGIDIVDT